MGGKDERERVQASLLPSKMWRGSEVNPLARSWSPVHTWLQRRLGSGGFIVVPTRPGSTFCVQETERRGAVSLQEFLFYSWGDTSVGSHITGMQ